MKNALLFLALTIAWGTSFYWTKLALHEIGPLLTVSFRFLFGFVTSFTLMKLNGVSLPRSPRTWLAFAGTSVIYSSLPVFLSTWGAGRVDAGLASILNATSPIFTLLFAVLLFGDESLTLPKLVAAVLGFVGMVVLVNFDAAPGSGTDLPGALAIVATSLCYGLSPGLTRRMLQTQHPLVQSTAVSGLASLTLLPIAASFEGLRLPALPATWAALLWLGVFSSATANLMYFVLLKAWGSSRASYTSYVIPLVGVATGVLLLNETVTWRMVAGGALVFAGIAAASLWRTPAKVPAR